MHEYRKPRTVRQQALRISKQPPIIISQQSDTTTGTTQRPHNNRQPIRQPTTIISPRHNRHTNRHRADTTGHLQTNATRLVRQRRGRGRSSGDRDHCSRRVEDNRLGCGNRSHQLTRNEPRTVLALRLHPLQRLVRIGGVVHRERLPDATSNLPPDQRGTTRPGLRHPPLDINPRRHRTPFVAIDAICQMPRMDGRGVLGTGHVECPLRIQRILESLEQFDALPPICPTPARR
ncbi:hypothetical protein C7C45_32440 [Micromonospora arborensis]|uniref:Uncharacterized protein n=1 Tax=Micromonospora arborensis TaxID=2116518 RepID=A0A318NA51_9ACTN|nr:hypothetical protein C7C45_32440 [Micromonospora arborensis]